tara:strand:+ start:137 stop:646 length:510 start_codon:yes stop_codon:yes gene_type:complete
MEFNYEWSMPNKKTFDIKPIKEYLQKICFIPNIKIVDPFANRNHKYANITNDINPNSNTDYNLCASTFLKKFEDNSIDIILFDPPYSLRQIKECYDSIGRSLSSEESKKFYSNIKDIISKKIKPGGKVISFGWSSVGIGKNRGFSKKELTVICHGGHHNDTIMLLEVKQ